MKRGYSLIEVFMAMLMVSMVILALASLFPSSMRTMRKSGTMVVADNLARRYLESYRQKPYNVLKTLGTQSQVDTIDGVEYDTQIAVTDLNPADLNTKRLDVRVLWDCGGLSGVTDITYTTCVYNTVNPW